MLRALDDLVARINECEMGPGQLREEILELLIRYRGPYVIREQIPFNQLEAVSEKLDSLLEKIDGSRCRYRESGDSSNLAYLVTGLNGDDGRQDLKEWLNGAKVLEIADPYFFHMGSYKDTTQLVRNFEEMLPRSLRRLSVYHKPNPSKALKQAFSDCIRGHGVQQDYFRTSILHDRVWIKDGNRAKVVGTSFNGLGNKLAFILDLPESDLRAFQVQMSNIRRRQRAGDSVCA
ncbi:MAG: hypothetical protein CMN57_02360 [Gammaproteobacteria bacterium]|nr:hypothetical protein [Gammaproteobacteria bacterium]